MSKVKTRTQLADEYGISRKTLYNWLKSNKVEVRSGQLTPLDQKKIHDKFGKPSEDSK